MVFTARVLYKDVYAFNKYTFNLKGLMAECPSRRQPKSDKGKRGKCIIRIQASNTTTAIHAHTDLEKKELIRQHQRKHLCRWSVAERKLEGHRVLEISANITYCKLHIVFGYSDFSEILIKLDMYVYSSF